LVTAREERTAGWLAGWLFSPHKGAGRAEGTRETRDEFLGCSRSVDVSSPPPCPAALISPGEEGVPLRDASRVNARAIPSGESAIRRTRAREMSRRLSTPSPPRREGSRIGYVHPGGIPREIADTKRLSRMPTASICIHIRGNRSLSVFRGATSSLYAAARARRSTINYRIYRVSGSAISVSRARACSMSLIALIGTVDYERRPRVRPGATERSIKHPPASPPADRGRGERERDERVTLGVARIADLDH